MARILRRIEAHYENREVPFGKIYEWHAPSVALECDCGERLVLSATGTATTCRCGADLSAFVPDLRGWESRLPDKLVHPWFYDARVRAEQHLRDEAAYPEGSPWRYEDVTADGKER
jgi:hypothetical protein